MEEKSFHVPIEEVLQHPKSLEHSMEESLSCKSQTRKSCYSLREILSHDLIKMEENPLYEFHNIAYTSVEENKNSQSTQTKNILPNRICSKERMIIAMISIMFIIMVVCIGVILNSILMKSPGNNSSLQNQSNTKHNDDYFIIQAIKQSRKENDPCTFTISREIVKKYNISSWVLNDNKNPDPGSYIESGPECHEYNLNIGHNAPHHQYIFVDNYRCGSICDETNLTLNNTIHLKVKYDEFYERSISFPISCKYRSVGKDDTSWCKHISGALWKQRDQYGQSFFHIGQLGR